MNPLNLIPAPYRALLLAVAIMLTVGAVVAWWHAHNVGQQQIGYDRAMSEVSAAQAKIAEAKRGKEIEDQKQADKEAEHAQQQINALERERNAASDDADRMRRLYYQAAERGRQAVACASGAGQGEPGADPIGVFAELLVRADRRAEEVAGYADRLRIAGLACERRYDAVTGH